MRSTTDAFSEGARKQGAEERRDFTKTAAYALITEFIFKIDNSIKTEAQQQPHDPFIKRLGEIVEGTPLSEKPSRFANEAMRSVIEQVQELARNTDGTSSRDEARYLSESFGNSIRMDYGTGHELNFLCYLYVRHRRGLLAINEVFAVLTEYFRTIRAYIKKFNIEAAGARGCWSVDDYQLLPFLFGSSENFDTPLRIEDCGHGVFYEAWAGKDGRGMLAKVCELGWPEINVGMLRMYDKEVLGKFVVTQHFIYSEYLPSDSAQ
ncbi:serine/threonine-protein phosphatase 2A activator [Pancytospora philotis]|nr:serine/threonine-protein phosphatase 2A activator [Pancytospora philotis]